MITQKMVYEEKCRFVKKLEEALLELDDVRAVEYRVLEGKDDGLDLELVRIDWHGEGDPHEYINVSGSDFSTILQEIVLLIQKYWAYGQLKVPERGDRLWKEARSYED